MAANELSHFTLEDDGTEIEIADTTARETAAAAVSSVTVSQSGDDVTISTTDGNGDTTEAGTFKSVENPVIEVNDAIEENDNGTETHTLKETTADGTVNEVGSAVLAQNQVTKIEKVDGVLSVTSVNQAGVETTDAVSEDYYATAYEQYVFKCTSSEALRTLSSNHFDVTIDVNTAIPDEAERLRFKKWLRAFNTINKFSTSTLTNQQQTVTGHVAGAFIMTENDDGITADILTGTRDDTGARVNVEYFQLSVDLAVSSDHDDDIFYNPQEFTVKAVTDVSTTATFHPANTPFYVVLRKTINTARTISTYKVAL